jgi:hypothetical protein
VLAVVFTCKLNAGQSGIEDVAEFIYPTPVDEIFCFDVLAITQKPLKVMMDLEAQIQLLIDNAPQDGITPQLVVSVAPVLMAIARKLRHTQYYILQNSQQSWVLTTLSNRANSSLKKRVVYAFPTIQDVSLVSSVGLDPHVLATSMCVTHILFQLLALEPVDSIVFLETSGTTNDATEISRSDLQNLVQQQLKRKSPQQVPPDIA